MYLNLFLMRFFKYLFHNYVHIESIWNQLFHGIHYIVAPVYTVGCHEGRYADGKISIKDYIITGR